MCVEHAICELVEGLGRSMIDLAGNGAGHWRFARHRSGYSAAPRACRCRCLHRYRERPMRRTRSLGASRRSAAAASRSAGDLAKRRVRRLVDEAMRYLGGMDIFVGNAGLAQRPVAVDGWTTSAWAHRAREYRQHVLHHARDSTELERSGRIVLVASTAGQRGEALHADYAASKGAMISYGNRSLWNWRRAISRSTPWHPAGSTPRWCCRRWLPRARPNRRGIPLGRLATRTTSPADRFFSAPRSRGNVTVRS